MHGFNKIYETFGKMNNRRVLLFGGAYGFEVLPIIEKVEDIFIVEPSKKLSQDKLFNRKVNYITPRIDGGLPKLNNNSFGLITCFGVLHHIPNVSSVINELVRLLKPGGYLLIREPIVSMGDWTKQRAGLTKRERGLPLTIFRSILLRANLTIVYEKMIMFPLIAKLKIRPYNLKFLVLCDSLLSTLFSWNYRYHAKNVFQKLRPTSIFYILKKEESIK